MHPKGQCVSFFLPAQDKLPDSEWETFFQDLHSQIELQGQTDLAKLVGKARAGVKKVLRSQPKKAHGFFFSESLQGYVTLEDKIEAFCLFGARFHVRPLLEEIFVHPEFILVDVSSYDIRVYRADFRHVEILQHYEFEDYHRSGQEGLPRIFSPQYRGVIPYKSILAVRAIARKVMDLTLYDSLPVVVTGLEDVRKIFLKNFSDESVVISHFDEDFFEKTCVEILEKIQVMRPAVMNFYSAQLKARLQRLLRSKKIITDLEVIVRAVAEGKVVHLVLPVERKLWGAIDLERGTVELHRKAKKETLSVDILGELAEEVVRQGGKIQFLGPHFFPGDSQLLAVLKGAS